MYSNDKRYVIGILYQDAYDERHFISYCLSIDPPELLPYPISQSNLDGASLLIPLLSSSAVLVICEEKISYLSEERILNLKINKTHMVCWDRIDHSDNLFLLANELGNLFILRLVFDGTVLTNLILDPLGEVCL